MNPLARNAVIAVVGMLVSVGLLALSLLVRSVTVFVVAALASAAVAVAVGVYEFIQAWLWSQRLAADGSHGRSVVVALAGGLMVVIAGVAVAAAVWVMALVFIG
jgi:hypothetical protein